MVVDVCLKRMVHGMNGESKAWKNESVLSNRRFKGCISSLPLQDPDGRLIDQS